MATGTSFQNSFNILSRFKDSLDHSKDAGRIVLKKDVQKALEALEYIDVLYSSPSLLHKVQVESVMLISNLVQALQGAVTEGTFESTTQQPQLIDSIQRVETVLKRCKKNRNVTKVENDPLFKK